MSAIGEIMEQQIPASKPYCCAPARANRKLLANLSRVFGAMCWLSVVYSLAVITLNWLALARAASPDPAGMARTAIAGTIYQLITGTVLACLFMWVSQITKLLLESAPPPSPAD
jgi:hypothetical protein